MLLIEGSSTSNFSTLGLTSVALFSSIHMQIGSPLMSRSMQPMSARSMHSLLSVNMVRMNWRSCGLVIRNFRRNLRRQLLSFMSLMAEFSSRKAAPSMNRGLMMMGVLLWH